MKGSTPYKFTNKILVFYDMKKLNIMAKNELIAKCKKLANILYIMELNYTKS